MCIKDEKRRAGNIKITCVENDVFMNSQYRLHRHQLIDCKSDKSNVAHYCDAFGVAKYVFKSSDYNNKNEICVELKNLTIRRINEKEFKEFVKQWNNDRSKRFDPFGFGFGGSFKKKMDLNCARLCCQAFFSDNRTSKAITSDKIQNCKSEIKVHQWNQETETKVSGGDKFYVFLSELKTDQREISAHFCDEQEREFEMVQPDYIHCNRAIRLTVPAYPLNGIEPPELLFRENRIPCKFYLASKNKNYKSEFLYFHYLPDCLKCLDSSSKKILSPNKRLHEDENECDVKNKEMKGDLFPNQFDIIDEFLDNFLTNTPEISSFESVE